MPFSCPRPTFDDILKTLLEMRADLRGPTPSVDTSMLSAVDRDSPGARARSMHLAPVVEDEEEDSEDESDEGSKGGVMSHTKSSGPVSLRPSPDTDSSNPMGPRTSAPPRSPSSGSVFAEPVSPAIVVTNVDEKASANGLEDVRLSLGRQLLGQPLENVPERKR